MPCHSNGLEDEANLTVDIGTILANRYQVVKSIGMGSSSRVFQCCDLKRKEMVCVKVLSNEGNNFDAGLSEIRILMLFNQDDAMAEEPVVKLHDYFYFKEHLIIVTECLRETLTQHLKFAHGSSGVGINPAVVAAQAKKLLKALKFIHSHDAIHCDIKPDNICLESQDPCHVKLIDFGSCVCRLDSLNSYMQSRWYRAPEVILGIPPDFKVDLWSLGCTLAEEVVGFPIFKGSSIAAVLAAQQAVLGPHPTTLLAKSQPDVRAMYFMPNDKLYVLDPPGEERAAYKLLPVPQPLAELLSSNDSLMGDFIASLLQYEPANRPDASAALEHPFLANVPDPPLASIQELSAALVDDGTQNVTNLSSASSSFRSEARTASSFRGEAPSRLSSFNGIPPRSSTSASVLSHAGLLDTEPLWSKASRSV